MASHEKFDPRLDALVVETKTLWDPAVGELPDEDRIWLAEALHREPWKAKQIRYERTHTGFIRVITVTLEDIERLYEERLASQAE